MDTNEIIDELTRELFEHAPTEVAGSIAEVAGPVAAAREALDALVAESGRAQAQ